jgi:hypothetical protein
MFGLILRTNLRVGLPVANRAFSKTVNEIPMEFKERLVALFKKGDHQELIATIEASPFKGDPNLRELQSISKEILKEHFVLQFQKTENGSESLRDQNLNQNFPPNAHA